jgi:hypothetical protein
LTICSNHSHRFIKEPWVTPERVTPKSCYPFKKLQTFSKHPNNYQTYQTKKQKKTKMKNKLTTCKKKTNKQKIHNPNMFQTKSTGSKQIQEVHRSFTY